jgi:demethylmenaquinone methyltransferase / 2-methoxy-6-polyprenyl-1,4-benzoquinol methylase
MDIKQKNTMPQSSGASRIEQMFSGIAPWYDFLNRLLSLRRDVIWRRELVRGIGLPLRPMILDLAAGTLDVSLEILRQQPDSQVVAADFSLAMLLKGKEKLKASRTAGKILPVAADAYDLPFGEAQCDAITIAFGIRNLPDRGAALKEMHRVLKPGGIVAILEFIPPESGWLQNFYKIYLNRLLPLVGRLFSKHTFAYSYLAESINTFPTAEAFGRQMQAAGFGEVRKRLLTFGVAYLFYGEKG